MTCLVLIKNEVSKRVCFNSLIWFVFQLLATVNLCNQALGQIKRAVFKKVRKQMKFPGISNKRNSSGFSWNKRKLRNTSVWALISIFVVFAGVSIRIHAFRLKKNLIKYYRNITEYFVLCTRVYRSNWKLPFLEKIRFKTLMIKFFSFHIKSNSQSFFFWGGGYKYQKFWFLTQGLITKVYSNMVQRIYWFIKYLRSI